MHKNPNNFSKLSGINTFPRSTKPGTSLLVGLGLTTIIVLVSLGVTTVVISSIRESANVTGANQAYYAAEGALEEGLWVNQGKGSGYSDSATVFTKPPQANYTISGQVSSDSNFKYGDGYGIPEPGSGNAGVGCDALNPVVKNPFWYDEPTKKFYYESSSAPPTATVYTDPKTHSCNWQKIKVGETVTIPLYYTDKSTGNSINIFSASSTFYLNLRTACTDGNLMCTRPHLDTTKGSNSYKYGSTYDDPIVSWQIVGQSPDGSKTYILSPYLEFNTFTGWKVTSTILYKTKINAPPASGILTQASGGVDPTGCRGSIIKFLTGIGSGQPCSSAWSSYNLTKPVLKLSVIHSLDEAGAGSIPNLEYQLITDNSVTSPPTDTVQTITAEGYSGTFKQVLEVKNPQESGLLEYVIQQ